MAFWFTGDGEHEDSRFIDGVPGGLPAGLGLYTAAGSRCMYSIRYRREREIPAQWFIPDHWVRGQPNGVRIAKALARNGVLIRMDGGYGFGWIRPENTPDALKASRKLKAAKQAERRKRRMEEGQ
ncbi:hypothetical protein [Mycolicibacterium sphagni]|uniref:hypothetical protein n=1 Tax=Mycolicibacterium sphagni TaxID=1786 RepID=UPI0021F2B6F7|nr:hypothetical protein [Mycolicibacterium sphagni]MCV7179536.1 hypothetical protein [Mycolicibacterium sphagni]